MNKGLSMGLSKSYQQLNKKGPSTFALLVDDIRNMSAPQQKLLWMELNKEKISTFAKDIDTHVVSNNLNAAEINTLIKEAQKNGKRKKKG